MAIKFDDLSKVATSVHKDDYHTSGFQLKTKQKTSYQNIVLSSQVDLFSGKEATPTKLTVKWPKPFGIKSAFIDKLEVDKSGKIKLEASTSDLYPGLMLELKSDLVDASKLVAGFTYTDYKETQVIFECKATNPQDFNCESTYAKGQAIFGCKMNASMFKGSAPDLGVRFKNGPLCCSVLATDALKAYSASVAYKAGDINGAVTYQHGGKASGSFTAGVAYKGSTKIKVDQSQTVSCSHKHSVSKGFTLLGGASYSVPKGSSQFGLQLSIE